MTNKKTIWVTGDKGFLGGEIAHHLNERGYLIAGTDVELSVCEPERLDAFAQEIRPDVIINSAGISREVVGLGNRVKAYETNALGARNVAVVANAVDAFVVQISTDDVYPVRMAEPANEFDTPNPETPYGKSKRAGEEMVRNATHKHLIVRSSWVYSVSGGQVKKALEAAKNGETIIARTDQYASPTSILTYMDVLVEAIERETTGVLHITAPGVVSRYDFLSKVLEVCGYDPKKVLVPKSDLVTSEQVLLESMILEMYGMELPSWEQGVEEYFTAVGLAK